MTGISWLICVAISTSINALAVPEIHGEKRTRGLMTNFNGQYSTAPFDVNKLTLYVNDLTTYDDVDQPLKLNVKTPAAIASTRISKTAPVKILIPGWFDLYSDPLWRQMAINYLLDGATVIRLDWSTASFFPYRSAVDYGAKANSAVVTALADWMKYLVSTFGINAKDVHIVGHSLGAHIAGFTGKAVQAARPPIKLARITGLDPADPYFTGNPATSRLDSGDAVFVDTIMTNAVVNGYLGTTQPMGHYNFLPNGGQKQPNCKLETKFGFTADLCSHGRAIEYFSDSILYPDCGGVLCESYAKFTQGGCGTCTAGNVNCMTMGDKTTFTVPGQLTKNALFFLNTNANLALPYYCPP